MLPNKVLCMTQSIREYDKGYVNTSPPYDLGINSTEIELWLFPSIPSLSVNMRVKKWVRGTDGVETELETLETDKREYPFTPDGYQTALNDYTAMVNNKLNVMAHWVQDHTGDWANEDL